MAVPPSGWNSGSLLNGCRCQGVSNEFVRLTATPFSMEKYNSSHKNEEGILSECIRAAPPSGSAQSMKIHPFEIESFIFCLFQKQNQFIQKFILVRHHQLSIDAWPQASVAVLHKNKPTKNLNVKKISSSNITKTLNDVKIFCFQIQFVVTAYGCRKGHFIYHQKAMNQQEMQKMPANLVFSMANHINRTLTKNNVKQVAENY